MTPNPGSAAPEGPIETGEWCHFCSGWTESDDEGSCTSCGDDNVVPRDFRRVPVDRPTPSTPGEPSSATPEGKPTAREAALRILESLDSARDRLDSLDRITLSIEARDAIHAETVRRLHESYGKLLGSANHDVERLAAALQHGEERERVLREALEYVSQDDTHMCCDESCDENCCIASRTLATAQAMKEGTNHD